MPAPSQPGRPKAEGASYFVHMPNQQLLGTSLLHRGITSSVSHAAQASEYLVLPFVPDVFIQIFFYWRLVAMCQAVVLLGVYHTLFHIPVHSRAHS